MTIERLFGFKQQVEQIHQYDYPKCQKTGDIKTLLSKFPKQFDGFTALQTICNAFPNVNTDGNIINKLLSIDF